jgi:hypothetical protein
VATGFRPNFAATRPGVRRTSEWEQLGTDFLPLSESERNVDPSEDCVGVNAIWSSAGSAGVYWGSPRLSEILHSRRGRTDQ